MTTGYHDSYIAKTTGYQDDRLPGRNIAMKSCYHDNVTEFTHITELQLHQLYNVTRTELSLLLYHSCDHQHWSYLHLGEEACYEAVTVV